MKKTIVFLFSAMVALQSMAADIVAFPGAQGWGRWAKGARVSSSPTVYHVTNLNDSGTGSLRDAVSSSNRIVVFDVSGVIKISSRIVFKSNLYIAGQTAPGEGITVYGDGVSFSGSSNIICRYLRVRMGHNGSSGKDCAGIANGTNMIFDHCSFSWGLDETFSINPDSNNSLGNITLMNCIFGQGLMTHSAGGLMQADSITLYRNLYIDNSTRNNKVKGINQYANNVVYNWSNGCYIMGGDSNGSSYVNVQSNCFINGNSTSGSANAFTGANADFHVYGDDNWQDNNKNGVYDPYLITNYSAATRESVPYDYPELELYPGDSLIWLNIPTVGASLPYRDQSDCYMIDELMSFGTLGNLISNEESLAIGSPTTWKWWAGSKPLDSDGDGMPDAWEEANGTNKNSNDACQKAANGYLNIENYINSITVNDRQYFLRQPITLSAKSTTTTIALSWRDYTYAESGFAVEYKLSTDTEYTLAGKTAPNATSFTITGLTDGSTYDVRVRAFGDNAGVEAYSDYTTGTYKTRPVEVGIIDVENYHPTVTNSTDVKATDSLLLTSDDALAYTLTSAIEPAAVVAMGKGTVTVSGAAIGGTGTSVNKGDEGTLVMNYSANTYTGATVLHDGVLEFCSIADGGVNSAIGASSEFAQNWVWNGGTYRYTGGNASTNRSARLTNPTTLEIKNSKTLSMSGTIEGSGDDQNFTLDGNGQLEIASTNFFGYTGTTTLKGGTMYLSTVDIAKNGIGKSSKLVLAGGTLKTKGESLNYETYSFPIEVEENTYSYFAPNRNCYMRNTLTGAGTLELDIPYLREYFNCNLAGFTGMIVANGLNDTDGSLFLAESQFNMPTTRVYLKGIGKTYMTAWSTNAVNYVGGISGDAGTYLIGSSKNTKGSACQWIVGGANSDETFNGVITNLPAGLNKAYNGVVSITKVGTGLWRLNGNNDYSGTTALNEGTLIVNGKYTGGGTITVASEAVLKGCGSITKGIINVKSGGIITSGDSIVAGKTFNLTGSTLNLEQGSCFQVPLLYNGTTKKSNSFGIGTMNIKSGAVLKLDMSNVSGAIAPDTKFVVISANTAINGTFDTIEPATPGEGLQWDLSELYTYGNIYVREEGAEQYVYLTTNLMEETGKVDGEGYYLFNADNATISQQLVSDSVVVFDAAGKASLAPAYVMKDSESAVLGTGAVKMSKTAAVTFCAPGNVSSFKLALYRSSGTDWAQVYASCDGIEWTTLQLINTTKVSDLTTKNIQYFDLTEDKMAQKEYRYLKVEQANGASPTYLVGVSITYLKRTVGLDEVEDDSETDTDIYDLNGRKAGREGGRIVIIGGKKTITKDF